MQVGAALVAPRPHRLLEHRRLPQVGLERAASPAHRHNGAARLVEQPLRVDVHLRLERVVEDRNEVRLVVVARPCGARGERVGCGPCAGVEWRHGGFSGWTHDGSH